MRDSTGIRTRQAARLLTWLHAQTSDVLPPARQIASQLQPLDAYAVCCAFESLAAQRLIEQRHGTRSLHRGHRIVRINSTGHVLQTAGCPLELPA